MSDTKVPIHNITEVQSALNDDLLLIDNKDGQGNWKAKSIKKSNLLSGLAKSRDLDSYYKKEDADDKFETKTGAYNTYLKQSVATSTYLTKSSAQSDYVQKEPGKGLSSRDFTSSDEGHLDSLWSSHGGKEYYTKSEADGKFETKSDAASTYLTQTEASRTYMPANVGFPYERTLLWGNELYGGEKFEYNNEKAGVGYSWFNTFIGTDNRDIFYAYDYVNQKKIWDWNRGNDGHYYLLLSKSFNEFDAFEVWGSQDEKGHVCSTIFYKNELDFLYSKIEKSGKTDWGAIQKFDILKRQGTHWFINVYFSVISWGKRRWYGDADENSYIQSIYGLKMSASPQQPVYDRGDDKLISSSVKVHDVDVILDKKYSPSSNSSLQINYSIHNHSNAAVKVSYDNKSTWTDSSSSPITASTSWTGENAGTDEKSYTLWMKVEDANFVTAYYKFDYKYKLNSDGKVIWHMYHDESASINESRVNAGLPALY